MRTWKYQVAGTDKNGEPWRRSGRIEAERIHEAINAAGREARAGLSDEFKPYSITALRIISLKSRNSATSPASAGSEPATPKSE